MDAWGRIRGGSQEKSGVIWVGNFGGAYLL